VPRYGEGPGGRSEALPVRSGGPPPGFRSPCATITGFESAPGAEQRQRSSPEAEPLVRRADRQCAARKRQKPRIAPGPRLWAVPYTRLTPGQIPLSTQALIMRRLEPASIHADATMAEVSAALTGTTRPVFTHVVGLARTWFHAHTCDWPGAPMKKGRARSCDRVRDP
jgi:hypothetical protein